MKIINWIIPLGELDWKNSNKSIHPENLGENPLVLKILHSFENADKISRHLDELLQPYGKPSAEVTAMS
jgi:hypothetical protein